MSTGVNDPTAAAVDTPTAAPLPGTPEYDQAMADKYVDANSPTPVEEPVPATDAAPAAEATPEEPATPGLTIETQEEPNEEGKEDTSEGKQEDPADTAAAIPAELFDKASEEFAQTGVLTDETIESFVSKGIPREFIDTYVAGARALQAELTREAHDLVGGSDNWNAMMAWAKTLPQGDKEAFNEAVTNPKTSTLAIQGLYSRFTAANGSEAPSASAGAEHGAIGGDVYQSKAEMTSDMRDPRYKADAAFRAGVEQKIARSRKAGTLGTLGTAY